MRIFSARPRCAWLAVCVFALAASSGTVAADKKKPSLTMRAMPANGFAPLKVAVNVIIQGGANDYQEFYCPSIEWDWDDGTRSEEKIDCEPYEAGRSEIRRNYRSEHRFNIGGDFRVQFRLKQKKKTVGSTSTTIRVQPGITDGYR